MGRYWDEVNVPGRLYSPGQVDAVGGFQGDLTRVIKCGRPGEHKYQGFSYRKTPASSLTFEKAR